MRLLVILFFFGWALHAVATPPQTVRVDLQHGGDASTEHYALERVVVEALPWPGNPDRPIDGTNRGMNLFEVMTPPAAK